MKLDKKKSIPVKIITVISVILYTLWLFSNRKQSFKDALSFLTSYHSKISSAIDRDMPGILKGITFDDMMSDVLQLVGAYHEETSDVPVLLNSPTQPIIDKIDERISLDISNYLDGIRRKVDEISTNILPNYVNTIMVNFDKEFQQHVVNVDSQEDVKEIVDYYIRMVTTMRPRVEKELRDVFSENTRQRLERIEEFSSLSKIGLLETYRRTIETAKKIQFEMDIRNQVKNIVVFDIQERLIQVTERNIKYEVFEDHVNDEIDINVLLDELYVDAKDVRSGVEDEIEFRVTNGHIPNILTNNVSKVFLNRLDSIREDNVLTDDQRSSLNSFAQRLFDDLSERVDEIIDSDDLSQETLLGHANRYLKVVLPDIRTYIWAIFIEFGSVIRRSRLEGSQSCIVQFYHMRRVMTFDFFFALSEEESFDTEKTRTRFEDLYESSMRDARSKMISLVRMPFITLQYEDSFDFLNTLSEVLLFTDDALRNMLVSLTSDFHDKLSDSIGIFLDRGIEDVFQEEADDSRVAVMSVFEDFEGSMEVFKVSNVVEEFSSSMFSEISYQSDFVLSLMDDLISSFNSDTIEPYTEEFFEETKKSFITDSKVDFDEMKRFVVEHMNERGAEILKEYDTGLVGFIDNKIIPVGDLMDRIVGDVRVVITSSPISDADKGFMFESLDKKVVDVRRVIASTKTSLVATLHRLIRASISNLDIIMDTMTQNFFNIAIYETVQEFQNLTLPQFTSMFEDSITRISEDQKVLAEEAKSIFEEHAIKFVEIENKHRKIINDGILGALDGEVERILLDFNTVSFEARKNVVRNNLKVISNQKTLEFERSRLSELSTAGLNYTRAKLNFSNKMNRMHQEHVQTFNKIYSELVNSAYIRGGDILSHVSSVINTIEGDLRGYFTDIHGEQSFMILAGPNNKLPDINMTSMSYPLGLISIAEPRDGDIWSVMEPHLILEPTYDDGEQLVDVGLVEETTEQILGTSPEDFYSQIQLALSNYDTWKDNLIDEEIVKLEESLADELRNNTCPTRPTCEDGTFDCEQEKRSCREGYVIRNNTHGVPCCFFDPPAAGFPTAEIGRMLGVEMAWALATDPGFVTFMAKTSRSLGVKMGSTAINAGRSIGIVSRFSTKVSGAVARANVKIANKVASKVGYKTGMRMGGRLAAKLGVKTGTKIATALGKTLLKSLGKVAVSGPVAAALIVFDLLSLAIDLWDPAGYNDVQAAGQIKSSRDAILKQFTENLENNGITSPLVADPMYNIDPSKQGDFIENIVIDWYTEKISEFLSANETRWESMPTSEIVLEYENELVMLETLMDTEVNFIQELINQNTENTFMVKSSTIVGTASHLVGTSGDPDYDLVSNTHIQVCSLTTTGIVAFNSFQVQKINFINTLRSNPLFRLTKISHTGNNIYKDVDVADIVKSGKTIVPTKEFEKDNAEDILVGWALIEMDPEKEFWRQYTYMKEEGLETLPNRNDYIKAWDQLAIEQDEMYEKTILSIMEEELATLVPLGEAAATVDMIKKQNEDSPEWYPNYDELYARSKNSVDDNIAEIVEAERVALVQSEEATKKVLEDSDQEIAANLGISVEEAKENRENAEKEALSIPLDPDFAIFKDGFGQVSPLYSIKKTCDDMGYGNYFDTQKGLCEFTREYCDRFGLTYFYNADVGTQDCKITGVQKGFETVFGTTVTRTFIRLGESGPGLGASRGISDTNEAARLGVSGETKTRKKRKTPLLIGATGKAVRTPVTTEESVFEKAVKLEALSLGARFSIWN